MEQKELARLKKDEVGDVLEADELKKTAVSYTHLAYGFFNSTVGYDKEG